MEWHAEDGSVVSADEWAAGDTTPTADSDTADEAVSDTAAGETATVTVVKLSSLVIVPVAAVGFAAA